MGETPFTVVIPARYASTRLPGKPLLEIVGRPMLQHVYERSLQSGARQVIIATDDPRIAEAANDFNATVCMTSAAHTSGTERLAEVVESQGWDDEDIIVNVQGDEPLIPPALIKQVANGLASNAAAVVATLAYPIQSGEEGSDPNIVKVVLDKHGYALYFSRAFIPCHRDGPMLENSSVALRHIGLYAYRAGFLKHYRQLQPSPLESIEKLEQLRVLWHGMKIHVGIATEMPGHGVDTREDLARVNQLLTDSR
ncbi:MAG: 3-deoxy-manno-octulosonate cytidylyltransferase [Gammaproteobacteria bacterium]|jgi:3-deoxy-manno-octulosonate cytidylyltransferase (CMP-KDO synthetase)|nr:3-deoxy-manno-octulosonate cytidylyltransferase [Gammaproteobacteria bacterium]